MPGSAGVRGPRRRVEEGTAAAVARCCASCVTVRGERFPHIAAKIDGKVNPADILTKPCAGGIQFEKQVKVAMGIVPEGFDSPEILKARRVVRSVPRS